MVSDAAFNLGVYYSSQENPCKDDTEAIKYFRMAAEQVRSE